MCIVRDLLLLDAGGHTAEMLNFVSALSPRRYASRWYVAAMTDDMSLVRAQNAEESAAELAYSSGKVKIIVPHHH